MMSRPELDVLVRLAIPAGVFLALISLPAGRRWLAHVNRDWNKEQVRRFFNLLALVLLLIVFAAGLIYLSYAD